MRENTYLKAIKKDIKELKADIKEIQKLMIEFARVQNSKTTAFQVIIDCMIKGMQENKEAEDKKIETLLNMLFVITERTTQNKVLQ